MFNAELISLKKIGAGYCCAIENQPRYVCYLSDIKTRKFLSEVGFLYVVLDTMT